MSDRYRTEYKSGGFFDITPNVSYDFDLETNDYVGEVAHWDHDDIGELIAEGKWEPYWPESDDESDAQSEDE